MRKPLIVGLVVCGLIMGLVVSITGCGGGGSSKKAAVGSSAKTGTVIIVGEGS